MRLLLVLGLVLSPIAWGAACSAKGPSGLPIIEVSAEGHTIKAEVAQTADAHARGLMYRRELGTNKGMLFAYDQPQNLSFWMKNTFVPLSIAFLERDGTIVHIADMQPQSLTAHRCPKPVPYALEMNQGWFKERGIGPGARLQFELPSAD